VATINGLLTYLQLRVPAALPALHDAHPDHAPALLPDVMLGPGETHATSAEPGELGLNAEIITQLLHAALGPISADLNGLIHRRLRRLRLCNGVKLAGATVSIAAGSASVLLVGLGIEQRNALLTATLLTALGGCATVFASFLERSGSGVRTALVDDVNRLARLDGELAQLHRVLQRHPLVPIAPAQAMEMLHKLDGIAMEIVALGIDGKKRRLVPPFPG
jgi:hypothetical protein